MHRESALDTWLINMNNIFENEKKIFWLLDPGGGYRDIEKIDFSKKHRIFIDSCRVSYTNQIWILGIKVCEGVIENTAYLVTNPSLYSPPGSKSQKNFFPFSKMLSVLINQECSADSQYIKIFLSNVEYF